MKRIISFICVVCMAFLLIACSDKRDDSLYKMWNNAFEFEDYAGEVKNFKYYIHEKGTSSVNTRVVVYRYKEYLMFSYAYFAGGDSFFETFPLNKEQGEKFLALVENSEETEELSYNSGEVGGHYYKYVLKRGVSSSNIKGLDLTKLNLEITDVDDIELNDDYVAYDKYDRIFDFSDDRYDKFGTYDGIYLSDSTIDVYCSIYSQIKEHLNEKPSSIKLLKVNRNDAELKIEFDDCEDKTIIVTLGGCIVDIIE